MLRIEEEIISFFPETAQCLHEANPMASIINLNALHRSVLNLPLCFSIIHQPILYVYSGIMIAFLPCFQQRKIEC